MQTAVSGVSCDWAPRVDSPGAKEGGLGPPQSNQTAFKMQMMLPVSGLLQE